MHRALRRRRTFQGEDDLIARSCSGHADGATAVNEPVAGRPSLSMARSGSRQMLLFQSRPQHQVEDLNRVLHGIQLNVPISRLAAFRKNVLTLFTANAKQLAIRSTPVRPSVGRVASQ